MSIITPMMRQYQAVKEQYPDCLLFFRLGDFYELFQDDALVASRELNLVLTARAGGISGAKEKVPMCGVPYHAVNNYVARLIEKGYKIAICEQLEDPKQAKGIVKRDVIRVITPGTVIEDNMLQETVHNYLAACWQAVDRTGEEVAFGLAYTDISTGEFMATEIRGSALRERLADELSRIRPAELILPEHLYNDKFFQLRVKGNYAGVLSRCFDENYIARSHQELLQMHFEIASVEGLGLADKPFASRACAMILDFLQQTQKRSLQYIDTIRLYGSNEFMFMDASTRRNLELVETIRTHKRKGSLLWVLDSTRTAMGARLLREWVESPLLSTEAIVQRLDAVAELIDQSMLLEDMRAVLRQLYDIPRLISRISYGSAGPRDLAALRATLNVLPELFSLVGRLNSSLFRFLFDNLDMLTDISQLLNEALSEEPPLSARDNGVIKMGYDAEIDRLRDLAYSAKDKLLQMEAEEREKTGIKTLKIGFNKVFGYYIEISKSRTAEAPERYIRKQTLVNAERYITEELKALENSILSAGDQLAALEYHLFTEIRSKVDAAASRIRRSAEVVATVDVLQSLATVAMANHYCRPKINDGSAIIIKEGRHPVVEQVIGLENYIPNDCYLDNENQRMMLITGPNMAGKSTYMRQVALTVLMARLGSFIPAADATIGYCDRIFTRVGAADDLASGQSTFMVEMNETSNILRNATKHSLIILDEIGRGTSTFDGLSIAWAVAEYIIQDNCAAKTLFATHYHELTALAENFPLIKNYSVAVKEKGNSILFLRKIVPGGADKSYGIQVAQLAGLPKSVLSRAKNILMQLEAEKHIQPRIEAYEPSLFDEDRAAHGADYSPLLQELQEIDVNALTPLDALMKIADWKQRYHE